MIETRNILTTPMKPEKIYIREDLIISKSSKDLCNNFHLSVNNDNKRLPLIQWLPTFYKSPTNTKFIKAAPVSYTNPLSFSLLCSHCFFNKQTTATTKAVSFLGIDRSHGWIPFGVLLTRNQLLIPLTNLTNAVKRDQCYVLTFLHVSLKSHIN